MSREVELVEVDRTVIGLPDQVRAALETAQAAGRLLEVKTGTVRQIAPGDPRIRVQVVLLEPVPAPPWWRLPSVRGALIATGLAAVGALVWAIVWAVTVAVAFVVAHLAQIVAVIIAIAALLLWLVSTGKCPGLHCGGCKG